MATYDPSKYMSEAEHPERVCPICDYEVASDDHFGSHVIQHNRIEEISAIERLLYYNWQMEQLIRKLTGKQGIEVIGETFRNEEKEKGNAS